MKPKKFEQLLLVLSKLDDCDSLCFMLLDEQTIGKKKHKQLRREMVAMLQSKLDALRVDVLKI
jgi:hypothetical protein